MIWKKWTPPKKSLTPIFHHMHLSWVMLTPLYLNPSLPPHSLIKHISNTTTSLLLQFSSIQSTNQTTFSSIFEINQICSVSLQIIPADVSGSTARSSSVQAPPASPSPPACESRACRTSSWSAPIASHLSGKNALTIDWSFICLNNFVERQIGQAVDMETETWKREGE